MRYALHQLGMQLAQPAHMLAHLTQHHLKNLEARYPEGMIYRFLDATNVLLERETRSFDRPAFGIASVQIGAKQVYVTEHAVVDHPFCTLRHFKKHTAHLGSKVLIVAPLAGHYASLLRDTVKRMLQTHDVYITDWKNARDISICEGTFDLDDYVALLLDFFKAMKGPFHVMAVCQPTVTVTVATLLCEQMNLPYKPSTVILMGGPIDTRKNPSVINHFAKSHSLAWFDSQCIYPVPPPHKGAMRRVCPGFLMLNGFMAVDPSRHLQSLITFYENLIHGSGDAVATHTQFYDEYRSVMDLPAEYVMQTLDRVFHRHLLPYGLFMWRDQPVKPSAWHTTPFLTIEGEKDNISPPGQTFALHNLTPNLPEYKKHHHLQKGTGHYGIFSGHRWREEIAPVIERFISKS